MLLSQTSVCAGAAGPAGARGRVYYAIVLPFVPSVYIYIYICMYIYIYILCIFIILCRVYYAPYASDVYTMSLF